MVFITFRENRRKTPEPLRTKRLVVSERSRTARCHEDEAILSINVAISLAPVRFPTKEKSRHHRSRCPEAISPHGCCVWRRDLFRKGSPEDKQMDHTGVPRQRQSAETIVCVTFGAPFQCFHCFLSFPCLSGLVAMCLETIVYVAGGR